MCDPQLTQLWHTTVTYMFSLGLIIGLVWGVLIARMVHKKEDK